uniref:CLIP domain-containing protein n=1 Tax=Glossina pallidipes TaxID=7398 RepID=A0A1A9ZP59_GLOPL
MQLLLNLALITSMFTFNLVHLIEAALYKDDPCLTKSEVGLCKPWAECPTIKNLLESGAYKLKEVENCGYDVKEEIICCPGLRTYVKISDTTDRTATHNFPLVPAVTQLFPHNNSFPPNAQVPPAIQSPTLSPTVQELFSQNNDFLSKADVQRTISNLNSNSSTNQQFALYKSTLESSQKVQKHMRKKFPYDAVVAQMLANQQQSEFQHINASSEIRTYPAQRTIRLWLGDNQVKFSSKSPSHLLIDPNYINHPQRLHNHTSYLLKQKIEFKNSSQMPQFIRQMLDNSLEKEVSATGVMIPNNQSLVDNFENNLTANRDNVSKQQPVESVGSEFQQFFSPKDHPKSRKVETKYRTEPILSIRPKNISVSDNSERAAIRDVEHHPEALLKIWLRMQSKALAKKKDKEVS